MDRLGKAIRKVGGRGLALAFFVVVLMPTLAWAQLDSATTSSQHSQSATTTTTSTTEPANFVSDWRFWALLGGVLLVILIIAMSRGRDRGDRTTVIK
jgi:hypothetical protein